MSRAGNDLSVDAAVDELRTLHDLVRWGASRFGQAALFYGHGTDNAIDEALQLVTHALHLPRDVSPELLQARLTREERRQVAELLVRRVTERRPAAYLIHEAWFAGLSFYVDERVLIPRSPIAELIEQGFDPWLDHERVERILDLCTGSGCIAVACAFAFPGAAVDAADISDDALQVARINVAQYGLEGQVQVIASDLYAGLPGRSYDLIVTNPPYVGRAEMASLPAEYGFEPRIGLRSGEQGLDCIQRILAGAADHLNPEGILVAEVGNSRQALEARFPRVPFVWVELQRGGEGVFVLTREELVRYLPEFREGAPSA